MQSIENVGNGVMRVGAHIADVSYFVHSYTKLDRDEKDCSTIVYFIQCNIPMLPRLLCEEMRLLNPGVDRLAFSVMWDIDSLCEILDHWIGRAVFGSYCKFSYQNAQEIIEGTFKRNKTISNDTGFAGLHGQFKWQDIIVDIQNVHKIAKHRRESRFGNGALKLNSWALLLSLQNLRDNLKDDPPLFDIIVLYATKLMRLATYFCTG
ncbi:hypothetical protein KI387_019786 [Taxus chinensis]|uniref:RNB domain-containing protein n=1 Tax=Taxus chinensis TaxID=29808 RepID=A0AA38G8G5_TAXCH|nr:hypothetical protein KI387_019786 [Taxus chinensis]